MKILIFCLPGIGDALMATPFIHQLKKSFPEAEVDIACMFDGVRYIFKNSPFVNTIHRLPDYKASKIAWMKEVVDLRKYHYDISVLAYPAFRKEYHLVQWLAGAKKRVSHRYRYGYWS